MSAKEMFEKLGYTYSKGTDYIDYYYVNNKTIFKNNIDVIYNILFNLEDKTILIDTDHPDYANDISIKELQAINKQVEELGW